MRGDFTLLVIDTIEEAHQNVRTHDKTYFYTKTHIFNSLLLSGWICEAVWYKTNQNDGSC